MENLKKRVDALYLEYVFPVLATVRVGEDPAASELETGLLRSAEAVGIRVRRYILPAGVPQSDVELLIREINADFLLSALLLVQPLEGGLDAAALSALIDPKKDVSAPLPQGEERYLTLLRRVADAAERQAR